MREQGVLNETLVGRVTHFWSHLGVAGVHLSAPLDVGDRIHIIGHTTDFEQHVGSIEVEHQQVTHADAGTDVGIAVLDHAREHDEVYRFVDAAEIGGDEVSL